MAALIAFSGSAQASANELRIAGQTQAPDVLYSLTVSPAPGGACDLDVQDGTRDFPAPVSVAPGPHEARIVYRRPVRPTNVTVVASRRVDERGKPSGTREVVDTTLTRVHGSAGKRAGWRASFTLRPPYFLTVSTRWPGDPGCGLENRSRVAYSVAATG